MEMCKRSDGILRIGFVFQDKDESPPNEQAEEVKENGVSEPEEVKTPEADVSSGDQLNESSSVEKSGDSGEKAQETQEGNKKKEKTKKKKWSFRSISFSKKDKSKPNKEADKNGDVKEVAEEVSLFCFRQFSMFF